MNGNIIVIPTFIQNNSGGSCVNFEITIPNNYPNVAPIIHLRFNGQLISNNRYIDRNTNQLDHYSLNQWTRQSNLTDVLMKIIETVEKNPPTIQNPQQVRNGHHQSNQYTHQQHIYNQNMSQSYGSHQQPNQITVDSLTKFDQSELQKLSDVQLRELLNNKSKIQEIAENNKDYQKKIANIMNMENVNNKVAIEIIEKNTELNQKIVNYNQLVAAYDKQKEKYAELNKQKTQLQQQSKDTSNLENKLKKASDDAKKDSNELQLDGSVDEYVEKFMESRTKYYALEKKLAYIKSSSPQNTSGGVHYPSSQTNYMPPHHLAHQNSQLPYRNSLPTKGNSINHNPMFYTPQP